MPPQNSTSTPVPPSPGQNIHMHSLTKNPKFVQTVKTFVIYGTIITLVNVIVTVVVSALSWSAYYVPLSIGVLIGAAIGGLIGGLIAGVLFYFFYEPVHNWVKRVHFLSKYIHDIFTLFWKPFLVGTVITALFGLLGMLGLGATAVFVPGYAAVGFGALFIGWIVALVIHVAVYYWYAKQISSRLGKWWTW